MLAPCESTPITLPIKNEGTAAMEGCVVRLEEVAGLEYKVAGQVLASPFTIAVPTLAPGAQTNVQFSIGLKCKDPNVLPGTRYLVDVYLQCSPATLIAQICIDSPSPVLPKVGQ